MGVHLGGKPTSKIFWDNITEKINKNLSNWKYSYISKGGKLTLINTTLESLPTYQLSTFKAPIGVCKNIEKIWRNFSWKNPKEDNNYHLLKWTKVTAPKDKGGLGINKITDTNFALLSK